MPILNQLSIKIFTPACNENKMESHTVNHAADSNNLHCIYLHCAETAG